MDLPKCVSASIHNAHVGLSMHAYATLPGLTSPLRMQPHAAGAGAAKVTQHITRRPAPGENRVTESLHSTAIAEEAGEHKGARNKCHAVRPVRKHCHLEP